MQLFFYLCSSTYPLCLFSIIIFILLLYILLSERNIRSNLVSQKLTSENKMPKLFSSSKLVSCEFFFFCSAQRRRSFFAPIYTLLLINYYLFSLYFQMGSRLNKDSPGSFKFRESQSECLTWKCQGDALNIDGSSSSYTRSPFRPAPSLSTKSTHTAHQMRTELTDKVKKYVDAIFANL